MENKLLSWDQARQISIVKVLRDMGIAPERQTSKAAWYLSPLRTEKEASFCVTLNKNLWYDFGIAKGGNVIDLVINFKLCSPIDALRYLSNQSSFFFNPHVTKKHLTSSSIQVFKTQEIQHPALIQYLHSRAISVSFTRTLCKEVWYEYNGKTHFSIGLPNASGGWELRNKFFKNSTTPKSYSLISKEKEKVQLFEGMFDLLSLGTMDRDLMNTSDCLVLNSLSFLFKSFPVLSRYQRIDSYLDNDRAGREATQKLKEFSRNVKDCSFSYREHKDLNEKLRLLRQQF